MKILRHIKSVKHLESKSL